MLNYGEFSWRNLVKLLVEVLSVYRGLAKVAFHFQNLQVELLYLTFFSVRFLKSWLSRYLEEWMTKFSKLHSKCFRMFALCEFVVKLMRYLIVRLLLLLRHELRKSYWNQRLNIEFDAFHATITLMTRIFFSKSYSNPLTCDW